MSKKLVNEEFDFSAAYRVEGWNGVAWHADNYEAIYDEDYEWSGMVDINEDRVVCHMVGDDSKFTFEVDELTKLEEGDYCPGCGQIGCTALLGE